MKILAIETSCDETALAIIEGSGDLTSPSFSVLGEVLLSQIDIHKEWGGVVPNLAKRAHVENILPLLSEVLRKSGFLIQKNVTISKEKKQEVQTILERERGLSEKLIEFAERNKIPEIDAIAVTNGPGLEPALWVGINFAKALSTLWDKPLIPVNHMEGHILSVLLEEKEGVFSTKKITYPALALLISGGHTELVLIKEPLSYEIIGRTRDDAVGEAFDKVARLLELPYPGGPEISKMAEKASDNKEFDFPRPMIDSPDFDFSFSGLKTKVLYTVKELEILSNEHKASIAKEFEDAVTDVLLSKTIRAMEETGATTLIIGGGVSANRKIRETFSEELSKKYGEGSLLLPLPKLSTDNAVMIALAGYMRFKSGDPLPNINETKAEGNLVLN